MSFPEIERVIYKRNPLTEVVCQFNFPTILKIEREIPVDFQEKVRDFFCNYEPLEKEGYGLDFKSGSMPAFKKLSSKIFIFKSADEKWKVTLENNSISLLTSEYTRWEDFKDQVQKVFTAFVAVYQPKAFNRIGLRYVNTIRPDELGLKNEPWESLLNQAVIGCLSSEYLPEKIVKNYLGEFTIELGEGLGRMNANYGLIASTETQKAAFGIAGDFYTSSAEKFEGEMDHVFAKLDAYKSRANRFFRWCISEKLHKALEPQPIT